MNRVTHDLHQVTKASAHLDRHITEACHPCISLKTAGQLKSELYSYSFLYSYVGAGDNTQPCSDWQLESCWHSFPITRRKCLVVTCLSNQQTQAYFYQVEAYTRGIVLRLSDARKLNCTSRANSGVQHRHSAI